MPIVLPPEIPAYNTLLAENIFVMQKNRACRQDIRPIEIAIVNLMPTKIETETQLVRLLGNSPLQVNITFVKTKTYTAKNAQLSHMNKFYLTYDDIKKRKFDGIIFTGAPVEKMEFESVDYWQELCKLLDFARKNVTSSLFICWGAQAGLKHYYNIEKKLLKKKMFGIYNYTATTKFDPLLKGLNDSFAVPMSRHTHIDEHQVYTNSQLNVLANSPKQGISIIKSLNDREFYFLGHVEYDRETLKNEYIRDLEKGQEIAKPENYFIKNDINNINMAWASTASILFNNWLNFYVYQVTPYDITLIDNSKPFNQST